MTDSGPSRFGRAVVDRPPRYSYHRAVIVTIDRAGRIVVPKSLRERFNLVAGVQLEMEAGGDFLQLRRVDAEPALVRKKGILVHQGGTCPDLDVAGFIRAERDARSRRVLPEGPE